MVRSRNRSLVALAGAVSLAALGAGTAHAAGVEDTVGGTVALGRAANYVRVNDFMAVWQNPANLAIAPNAELGLELRLPIMGACFDRAKDNAKDYKEPGAAPGFQGSESFGQRCNRAAPAPAGNLGFASGHEKWGWGVGAFTPAGVGNLEFGDDTIVTFPPYYANEQYDITQNGVQSPNRSLLIQREVLAAFLMAGGAWAPIPEFRVGASVGFGFTSIHFKNTASLTGDTFVDQEVVNDVHVSDWFVPRATASIVYAPLKSLELMLQATYNGDIEAKGYVDVTANGIQGAPLGDCTAADPGPRCRVDDAKLKAPYQPIELTFGARYAQKRVGHEAGNDPLRDEVWDIELDAFWAKTSHVDNYTLTLYDAPVGAPGSARIDFTSDPSGSPSPIPAKASLAHQWRDTFGARLGADYNVLPEVLAVRAGLSYQSSAIPKGYMNVDYWAVQKIGLHVGATWAINKLALSIAYAHLFQEEVNVDVGEGRIKEVAAINPEAAQVVNEGRYLSGVDIVSVQANYRF